MKKVFLWNLSGLLFTLLVGTLLHFVYDWFGGSFWAVLGAVNESTWEHLKLVFWPIVLFGFIEYLFYGRNIRGFLPTKVFSLLIAMVSIVVVFYTYTGIIGDHFLVLDILTFVIGAVLTYWFAYCQLKKARSMDTNKFLWGFSMILLIVLLISFIIFTFDPPHIALFLDPAQGSYGL